MRGLICYHSNSGNTRLLAQYAARKLDCAAFDLLDISAGESLPDLSPYAVIGFATWTYYMGLPPRMAAFLESLPTLPGKPVFVLSSFGMMPGWSLRLMEQPLREKGCQVLGGHALHMPENYPPLIVKGMDSPGAPEAKELTAFDAFLGQMRQQLAALQAGRAAESAKIAFDWFNYLIRPFGIGKIRKDMGALAVDPDLCGGCQTCQRVCQYQAIRFEKTPVFDSARCQGCYACFNHCPKQAIYTTKIRGRGQYQGPSAALVEKLN